VVRVAHATAVGTGVDGLGPGPRGGGGVEHPGQAIEGAPVAGPQLDRCQLQRQVGAEPGVADPVEEGAALRKGESLASDVGRGRDPGGSSADSRSSGHDPPPPGWRRCPSARPTAPTSAPGPPTSQPRTARPQRRRRAGPRPAAARHRPAAQRRNRSRPIRSSVRPELDGEVWSRTRRRSDRPPRSPDRAARARRTGRQTSLVGNERSICTGLSAVADVGSLVLGYVLGEMPRRPVRGLSRARGSGRGGQLAGDPSKTG
jgi:hypothetical protein